MLTADIQWALRLLERDRETMAELDDVTLAYRLARRAGAFAAELEAEGHRDAAATSREIARAAGDMVDEVYRIEADARRAGRDPLAD